MGGEARGYVRTYIVLYEEENPSQHYRATAWLGTPGTPVSVLKLGDAAP